MSGYPDPGDHRVRRVALTATGRSVVDGAREHRAELEATLVERHGRRAVDSARGVLVSVLELTGGLPDASHRAVRPPSD